MAQTLAGDWFDTLQTFQRLAGAIVYGGSQPTIGGGVRVLPWRNLNLASLTAGATAAL